ncbi:MAG: putative sulfate exporter family transporter, partial [Desulfovibrio sp.]|nr:putative sulfate exporter family transporter [Desulfovibrio sp.]
MSEQKVDVVVDDGRAKISDLWKKEDYWAIWLGFLVLIVGYALFLAQTPPKFAETVNKANQTLKIAAETASFRTIEYFQAQDAKKKLRGRDSEAGKTIASYTRTPGRWNSNPLDSFYAPKATVDAANEKARPAAEAARAKEAAALEQAQAAQKAAEGAEYKDASLNRTAE